MLLSSTVCKERWFLFILLIYIIGKWKDDNLMGFLSIVVTRGIVKNFPVYSILLFDYNVLVCFVFDM